MMGHPNELQTRWLMAQRVTDTALLNPTSIRAANVAFLDDHTFDFDKTGVPALLFAVEEGDKEIDWVAWQPRHGKLACWRAAAFALGQEAIFNPATYFAGFTLRVHRTPLEWLKADRDGIVIVQPRYAHAYLRDARMSCPDAELARQVEEWIKSPRPRAEIFVEVSERAAA